HDLSRNHINILSCAAIVALPGSDGTASEVALALRYGKPVIAYSNDLALHGALPGSVRRVDRLDNLRHFLRECLTPPR
ncbi:MAG: hypothetical protein ACREBP_11255, partial [Sphingomicrobium sp.]